MGKCDGQRAPDRWRFWRPRHVYPTRGEQVVVRNAAGQRQTGEGSYGVEATAVRFLRMNLLDGTVLWQCAMGRWHPTPGTLPDFVEPQSTIDGAVCRYPASDPSATGAWGRMPYYDARTAHEVARRIRYRIPQAWEWAVLGLLAAGEAIRIAVGLLSA